MVFAESEVGLDADGLGADAERLLDALGRSDAELSLLLVDDARIAELNREWRGKDGPTDVLSFPMDDPLVLGDVVISVDTARRQAEALGHDVESELRVLLVHGLCHLLGHDHHAAADTARMREAEQGLLAVLGVPRGLVARAHDDG